MVLNLPVAEIYGDGSRERFCGSVRVAKLLLMVASAPEVRAIGAAGGGGLHYGTN